MIGGNSFYKLHPSKAASLVELMERKEFSLHHYCGKLIRNCVVNTETQNQVANFRVYKFVARRKRLRVELDGHSRRTGNLDAALRRAVSHRIRLLWPTRSSEGIRS